MIPRVQFSAKNALKMYKSLLLEHRVHAMGNIQEHDFFNFLFFWDGLSFKMEKNKEPFCGSRSPWKGRPRFFWTKKTLFPVHFLRAAYFFHNESCIANTLFWMNIQFMKLNTTYFHVNYAKQMPIWLSLLNFLSLHFIKFMP